MLSKRQRIFNIALVMLPWLSVLFLGKRNIKRYSLASFVIVILEIGNQIIGHKRKWYVFYNKPNAFAKNLLPFSLGPYMPMSMWMLKLGYGDFTRFLLLNVIGGALFAFPGIKLLKKWKIANLHRLNGVQFFIYLLYKAFILYGLQNVVEKQKR